MTNRIIGQLFSQQNPNGQTATATNDANEVAETAIKQATHVLKKAEQVVISHPVAALSVAIFAGVAVGWWVKRK